MPGRLQYRAILQGLSATTAELVLQAVRGAILDASQVRCAPQTYFCHLKTACFICPVNAGEKLVIAVPRTLHAEDTVVGR